MAICFVPKDFVLSIGGYKRGDRKTVEYHDIKNDSWGTISNLNEARSGASSCFHA